MHEIMRNTAGACQSRQLAGRHLAKVEPAFPQQLLRHNDDLVPRQRGADDGVRTGNVVGETIAGLDLDLTAILLEIRDPVGLEKNLDVRVFAGVACRRRVSDPMLAFLGLATVLFLTTGCGVY